jgi:hypothetical protein
MLAALQEAGWMGLLVQAAPEGFLVTHDSPVSVGSKLTLPSANL